MTARVVGGERIRLDPANEDLEDVPLLAFQLRDREDRVGARRDHRPYDDRLDTAGRRIVCAYDVGRSAWLDTVPEYRDFWEHFQRAAEAHAMVPVRADAVDPRPGEARRIRLVSCGWTELSARLISAGCSPSVLMNWEPPVIDVAFYARLREISARYPHTFVYPGARRRVAASSMSHDAFLPQMEVTPLEGPPWEARGLLTMIVAAKVTPRPTPLGFARALWARLTKGRRSEIPSIRLLLFRLLDPELRRELHSERLRAIAHFAGSPDFTLYGRGWDRPAVPGIAPRILAAARERYGGAPADKIATLSRFRFALCFENAIFPGCITEKIFNCFAADCIPVYYGAPDIEAYVPADTFVDMRRFASYDELHRYLRTVTPTEAARMRRAAREYLASPAFVGTFSGRSLADRVAAAAAGS